jgi:hypothetical protein
VRGFGIEVMMDGMATVFVCGWDCFLWFGTTTTTTTTTRLSGIGTGTFVLRWRIVTRGSETWDVSRLAACDYVHSSR